MDRRSFVKASSALSFAAAMPPVVFGQSSRSFTPAPGDWRTLEIVHRVEIGKPSGATKIWIPLPDYNADYQRHISTAWVLSSGKAVRYTDPSYGAGIVAVEFDAADAKPLVTVTSTVRTQSRALDWSKRGDAKLTADEMRMWTAPTELMPTDGIVLATAREATKGARTDVDKVRALFEWTIANTHRKLDTKGCGVGDVAAALQTSDFGGKCADINAIFVALSRASGVPARDVYGIRAVPSAFGYKELGAGSANITRAQHCRAEVFLDGYGWVAMDPADVGKVQRVETPEWIKTTNHPVVAPVHKALFGGWEGNWVAYNTAHDVALPGARGPKLPFMMYPQAETADGRFDPYDPDNFKYVINAREVKS